jgi:hypothetical protein
MGNEESKTKPDPFNHGPDEGAFHALHRRGAPLQVIGGVSEGDGLARQGVEHGAHVAVTDVSTLPRQTRHAPPKGPESTQMRPRCIR